MPRKFHFVCWGAISARCIQIQMHKRSFRATNKLSRSGQDGNDSTKLPHIRNVGGSLGCTCTIIGVQPRQDGFYTSCATNAFCSTTINVVLPSLGVFRGDGRRHQDYLRRSFSKRTGRCRGRRLQPNKAIPIPVPGGSATTRSVSRAEGARSGGREPGNVFARRTLSCHRR